MPANIAQFTAREAPAWWDDEGLYTFEKERVLTVSEAFEIAGMNYEFRKVPQFVEIEGDKVPTGMYSIVRPPVEQFIGEQIQSDEDPDDDGSGYHIFASNVGENFQIVQNKTLARIFDPISKEWPVETVGALRHGERIFVLLKAGSGEVGPTGDPIEKYFLLVDDKTGGMNIQLMFTSIRVVCANTHAAAIRSGQSTVKIPHTKDAIDTVELAAKIMHDAHESEEEVMSMYDMMAERKATEEEIESIVNAAFPLPTLSRRALAQQGKALAERSVVRQENLDITPGQRMKAKEAYERYQYKRKLAKQHREGALERVMAFNDFHPEMGGTVWAGFNGVTDYAD